MIGKFPEKKQFVKICWMDRREHRKKIQWVHSEAQSYYCILGNTFSKKLGQPPKWNEQLDEHSSESSTPRDSYLVSREAIKKGVMMATKVIGHSKSTNNLWSGKHQACFRLKKVEVKHALFSFLKVSYCLNSYLGRLLW